MGFVREFGRDLSVFMCHTRKQDQMMINGQNIIYKKKNRNMPFSQQKLVFMKEECVKCVHLRLTSTSVGTV